MNDLTRQVLRTDAAGMPLGWIDYQEATRLHSQGMIAYSFGSQLFKLRGGFNALTGQRSQIEINSIVATLGHSSLRKQGYRSYTPPLNNPTLFRRDAFTCLYCGQKFPRQELSRDHVTPISRKGLDNWNNVVAACKRCNNRKADRTPEQAAMQLKAIPFTPTHAEYIYLKGRRILADQMEFLQAHFPRTSPLHQRLRDAEG